MLRRVICFKLKTLNGFRNVIKYRIDQYSTRTKNCAKFGKTFLLTAGYLLV